MTSFWLVAIPVEPVNLIVVKLAGQHNNYTRQWITHVSIVVIIFGLDCLPSGIVPSFYRTKIIKRNSNFQNKNSSIFEISIHLQSVHNNKTVMVQNLYIQ